MYNLFTICKIFILFKLYKFRDDIKVKYFNRIYKRGILIMGKKFIATTLIACCIGGNLYAYASPIKEKQTITEPTKIERNISNLKVSNSDIFKSDGNIVNNGLSYDLRACMGKQSWSSFAWNVAMEGAGYLPAGKFQKVYDKVYLVVTKGYQLGTRDWESLCWTVVDVICAFVPGAVPAKVFWSICKLTPSF
ncbi:hypothetical protein HMPREF3222_01085 [Clostridium perfringens]|uniref:Uncharacterized protein n=1 Tax=Clostridium perfringens TaxID=1502 RepID=A0A133N988_CLOPF|nr:hypothetical protein HMPREF3222_01085 [Clostridium perfringens]